MPLASLSPFVIIHMWFAASALLLGPFALAARKGSRLHRAIGYGWVTLMLGAALTSIFIRDFRLPNIAGYTPIHLITLVTFGGIALGIWHIAHRNVRRHRLSMLATYIGGCIVAGGFTLLPNRYIGQLVWHQWLGWM